MEKINQVFDVSHCPLCGKRHRYNVAVMRSSVLFGATIKESPAEKRTRRLFTCPKTGEMFEGFVILQDDPVNKIVSVKVEGLIEEAE